MNGSEYLHDLPVENVSQVFRGIAVASGRTGLVALHFVLELLGGAGAAPLDAA
mgnify:CR=1 FL=1